MSAILSHEQADAVRDAVALVRIVQRYGVLPEGLEAAKREMEPVIDKAGEDALAMIVGVLAAMSAARYEDDELYEMALNAIGLRP